MIRQWVSSRAQHLGPIFHPEPQAVGLSPEHCPWVGRPCHGSDTLCITQTHPVLCITQSGKNSDLPGFCHKHSHEKHQLTIWGRQELLDFVREHHTCGFSHAWWEHWQQFKGLKQPKPNRVEPHNEHSAHPQTTLSLVRPTQGNSF